MRNRVAAAAVALIALAGCSKDAAMADLDQPTISGNIVPKDFVVTAPDKLTVFSNVDGHANIVRLCLAGTAFYTVSGTYTTLAQPAVTRMPEWDAYCKDAG